MAKTIFTLPVPSTSLLDNPIFKEELGRTCSITCCYESGIEVITLKLLFKGVEAYKSTYYKACTMDMMAAYDKVNIMDQSNWLNEIKEQLLKSNQTTMDLKHLAIYFDDGPCYEFICQSFNTEEKMITLNEFWKMQELNKGKM